MASDILITPNKGSAVTNAKIEFTGATSESSTMRIEVLTNGALSFIGSSGTAGIGIDGSIAGTFGSYSSYLTMGSLVANDPGASYYAFGHRIGGTLGISQGVSIGSGGAAAPSNGLLVGGNVGIGATAPSTVLDVDINRASQTDGIRIKNSNTGGYGHELNFNLYGYAGSTVGSFDVLSMRTQYNGTTGYVTFLTKAQPESTAVQSLFLQGDGNVGIGTSVFSVYSNFVGIQKDQSAPTRLLVSNQTNNASSSSELVVAAYGNSWVMGMGSSAKNSNALTWALDATAGTPSVKMTLNSSAGDLLLASTTAGASSVGALVVQGGISAGNTGAASYFGGTETYFQGSTGNTNLISTRAGTSNGATFQYKTGATLKWYHGLRGLVNDNFYIHNQSADVSALILDVATNAATFAGAVTATGTGAFGGSGSLGSTYLSRLSVFTAGAGNFSVGGQTNTNNTVVARMTAYNASNGNSGNGAATTFMGITSIESVVKTATNNAGEDSGGDLVFLTKGDGGTLTERMRLLSTGDVGIGTASPTYHLQVAGTGTQTSVASFRYDTGIIGEVGILSDATGGLLFARDGSGTSNTQINGKTNGHSYFNSGGSVCIGTTTPFGKFQLGPSNAVNTPISDILQLRYYDGDFYGSSAFHYYDNSQGMEKYVIGVSGIGGTLTGPNTIAQAKMVIQANGNVGIGTTSPTGNLEIAKTASGALGANLFLRNNAAVAAGNAVQISMCANSGGDATAPTGKIVLTEASNAYSKLGFFTYAADGVVERLTIANGGNVGIGTTAPAFQLNTSKATGNQSSIGITSGASSLVLAVQDVSSGRSAISWDNNAGGANNIMSLGFGAVTAGVPANPVLSLNQNGNVGIGTTGPNAPLHVTRANNNEWIAKIVNTGTNPYGLSIDTSANAGSEYTFAAYTNAGTGLLLRNNGQLGIGTASPGYQLAVSNNGAAGIELGATNGNFGEIYAYNRSSLAYIPLILQGGGGDIGVGTTIPGAKFHVSQALNLTNIDAANQLVQLENTQTDAVGLLTGIRFRGTNATNSYNSFLGLSSTGSGATRANFIIATPNTSGNAIERLRIDSSGIATFAGAVTTGGRIDVTGGVSGGVLTTSHGQIGASANGLEIIGRGATNDVVIYNKDGSQVCAVPTGTVNLVFNAGAVSGISTLSTTGAATFGGAVTATGTGAFGGSGTLGSTYLSRLSVFTAGGGNFSVGGQTNTNNTVVARMTAYNASNGNSVNESSTAFMGIASIESVVKTATGNAGTDSGGDLVFLTKGDGGSLTERMRLLSTGAATFSGDVTVSGAGTFSGSGGIVLNGATKVIYFGNPSANYLYFNGSDLITRINSVDRLTIASTGAATFAGAVSDSIGDIRILPQNSRSAAYTTVLSDSGKHILHPSADTTARTITIDSNANVAYVIGTAITFINQNAAGVLTIAITSDTMRLAGAGTTGSRTLAANGVATAVKITSTEWIISGTGLT